jgi:hypothetical protein
MASRNRVRIELGPDGPKKVEQSSKQKAILPLPGVSISTVQTKRQVVMDGLIGKTITAASALLTGTVISPERVKKRIEVCATCDKVRRDGDKMWCGVCGCALKGDKSLINLARYEETPAYGCKHPAGSRWKENDV